MLKFTYQVYKSSRREPRAYKDGTQVHQLDGIAGLETNNQTNYRETPDNNNWFHTSNWSIKISINNNQWEKI